jgi:competence protein ComEC
VKISEEGVADKTKASEENSDNKAIPTKVPSSTASPKASPTPKVIKPSIRHNGATVYVTKSGKKFHRENCTALSKSKIPLLFEEASEKGYTPCGICNP